MTKASTSRSLSSSSSPWTRRRSMFGRFGTGAWKSEWRVAQHALVANADRDLPCACRGCWACEARRFSRLPLPFRWTVVEHKRESCRAWSGPIRAQALGICAQVLARQRDRRDVVQAHDQHDPTLSFPPGRWVFVTFNQCHSAATPDPLFSFYGVSPGLSINNIIQR